MALSRALVALPLLLSSLLSAATARATQCQVIEGGTPELAALSAEERLEWLDHRLRIDGHHDLVWSALWGSAYGALTVTQLALWPTSSTTSDRAEKIVGASASFIGTLSVVALPPAAIADARWWAKHRLTHANDHPCSLLNTAERLLIRDAADDEFGVGPLVHLGNFIINIAAGLVLGLGYNDWKAWGYSTVVGIVVGEVQTATRPIESLEDLNRYRRGQLNHADIDRVHWGMAPMWSKNMWGIQLNLGW